MTREDRKQQRQRDQTGLGSASDLCKTRGFFMVPEISRTNLQSQMQGPPVPPDSPAHAASSAPVVPPRVPPAQPLHLHDPGRAASAGSTVPSSTSGNEGDKAALGKDIARWERVKSKLHWTARLLVGAATAAMLGFAMLGSPSSTGEKGEMHDVVHQLDVARNDVGLVRNSIFQLVSHVTLSPAELDVATTAAVRAALQRGDDASADRIFQQAQIALDDQSMQAQAGVRTTQPHPPPTSGATPPALAPARPELSSEQKKAIQKEELVLYRLNLWDCMQEDGDIVRILVNGRPYATVQLRHTTSTLLVPMPRDGATTIAVQGVYDGGGGITTGIRSSGGDFVLRSLRVGELIALTADVSSEPGP
jgi:hypothetical protein